MQERKEYKVVVPKFSSRSIAVWGEASSIERKTLEKIGAKIVEADTSSEEEFIEVAKDADAILYHGGGVKLNPKIIESLQNCKIIAVPTVGYDSVDIAAATDHGIWVTNVPDVFIEEVADHAMTLILASWRRLITQDNMVRTSRWLEARPMLNQFPRLMGMTLGFVAFGNIPRAVSRRAKPFGFHMMAYDPYIRELDMVKYDVEPITELSEILARSDFLSVHLPSSSETHHMISEQQFKEMKSTAIFINLF